MTCGMGLKRPSRGPLLTVAAAMALGCDSEDLSIARRYQVADTVVVENLKPILPDTLHPIEVERYGLREGPPEYLFTEIHSFAVDQAGSVFVFDRDDGIREYAVDGSYQGIVAGRGQGPGEVGYVVAMDATEVGRVGVVDLGNRRISVFMPSRSAWSVRMADGHAPYREGAIVFHRDGSLWVEASAAYPTEGGIPHPRPVFVRAAEDGTSPDTVFTPASVAYHCPTLTSISHAGGFWQDNRDPYDPMVKWAFGPDETFVVGCPASYRFYVYRRDGTVLRVARARPKVMVSPEERAFREQMPVPKASGALPAYAKLLAPDGDRIWVWPRQPDVKGLLAPEVAERFGVTHTWGLPWQGAFDVFTGEGEWLAVVADRKSVV